jgi:hypothetical protein
MIPTLPLDHGCWATHSISSRPSSAVCWLNRSKSPPEQPVPRTEA